MDTIEYSVANDKRADAGLGRVEGHEDARIHEKVEKSGEQIRFDGNDLEAGRAASVSTTGDPSHNIQEPPQVTKKGPFKALSILDQLLVLWIILSMAIGIILGNLVPSVGPALQRGTFVGVSGPIAVGLLVMMYPILCKVRFETLHLLVRSRELWKQIGISFVLNWIVAPLFMTALAWAFLPDRQELRDGLIFVGVARCIAMVLIWTDLAGGDGDYCAVLVAFNSILQIVLFAPFAVFYVRVVSHDPEDYDDDIYQDAATSVAVFLGIPLAAAIVTRLLLRWALGEQKYQQRFIKFIAPFSLIGLLYTIIVLFASQGAHVVSQITSVLRVCAPLVVYFLVIFPFTAWMMYRAGFGYKVSCTQSFTAASNNFELAIAVVVSTYGAGSEEALAATVGPLIEVPVLVGLVYVIRYFKHRWGWKESSE
ncbi:Sodium Bile acid symporter family [Teratosphaeria destructans]|uniref:Sodium Bile acid symporter family n=1 Tax=Teratosphaeria destructans TaxID=418781 RepID=A0A9W7SMF8_9PEZI|nr:Sodium Bile acid symporter family [Teratosphaeria destructans]